MTCSSLAMPLQSGELQTLQVVSRTSCTSYTSRLHTYTWLTIMFCELHMACSSLAIPLQSGQLHHAVFSAMLCIFQLIWKEYGKKILQSKSVSECADQAIWLYSLNGVCLWPAQSREKKTSRVYLHIYSHGKEQAYHKSEMGWEQILMSASSSQPENTVLSVYSEGYHQVKILQQGSS